MPGIVQSAIANVARIAMSGDGAATIELELIAAYRQLYRMINSLTDEKLAYDEAITDAALTNFPEPSLEFFTGYQGAIEYGNRLAHDGDFAAIATLPANDMTLEVNHDLTASTGFTQTLLPKEPVQGETGKVISLATTVDFESGDAADDVFPKWQDIFNNDERLSVRVTMFNVDSRGKLSVVQHLCGTRKSANCRNLMSMVQRKSHSLSLGKRNNRPARITRVKPKSRRGHRKEIR